MNYRLQHIAALAKLILISLGRTRSPSDLVNNHHDLEEVVQHAGDDYIVRSLRENAIIAHKPSVGLQDPVLKFDYSGPPRERPMPSSIGDVHDSGVDSRRHNMHQGPSSAPVRRQGTMVSLTTAHPLATSEIALHRRGLHGLQSRRRDRAPTGM